MMTSGEVMKLLEGGVFTQDLIQGWLAYKRKKEIASPSVDGLRPHPYEFSMYFDV